MTVRFDSRYKIQTPLKAISNSLRKYTRVYSNWIDICSVAPFCFDVIMRFFPNEFRLDNKADLQFQIFINFCNFKIFKNFHRNETSANTNFNNCGHLSPPNSDHFDNSNHSSVTPGPNAENISNCKNISSQYQFTNSYSDYDWFGWRVTLYGNAFGILDYYF